MSDSISKNKGLDVLSKNNIYFSKEQRKQIDEFNEIQKKLGLSQEKGARYNIRHPFDRRIQSDLEKGPVHKPPFYFERF